MQKSSLDNIASMLMGVASVTAEAINQERERNNAITRANWETMSRRERPIFVGSLREQNFTQQEIADVVGMTQPSISKYEKMYKTMKDKKIHV